MRRYPYSKFKHQQPRRDHNRAVGKMKSLFLVELITSFAKERQRTQHHHRLSPTLPLPLLSIYRQTDCRSGGTEAGGAGPSRRRRQACCGGGESVQSRTRTLRHGAVPSRGARAKVTIVGKRDDKKKHTHTNRPCFFFVLLSHGWIDVVKQFFFCLSFFALFFSFAS